MELIFPFRNWALNSLLAFFEKENVRSFQEFKESEEEEESYFFKHYVHFYRSRLPDFEDEILQVINTTNQSTIDHYFEQLNNGYAVLSEKLEEEYLLQKVYSWNKDIQTDFNKMIEKKTDEYFEKEERTKYGHLEEYEDFAYPLGFGIFADRKDEKIKKVNYNYYCLKDKLNLIPIEIITEYKTIVDGLAKEYTDIAAKYYKKWNEGLIKSKSNINIDGLFSKGIQELIDNGENDQTEFKSSLRYCLKMKSHQKYIEHSVFKNIAAFLNTNGGVLLIGIEDNGNILGLEDTDYLTFNYVDKRDSFLKHFDNLIEKYLGNDYNSIIKIDLTAINSKTIAKVLVMNCYHEPTFLKIQENGQQSRESFYIRRSASAVELPIREAVKYIKTKWN